MTPVVAAQNTHDIAQYYKHWRKEMFNQILNVEENFLNLFILSAPWLLFGFFMAAMIKVFIKLETMQKYLGGDSWWVTVKAALIGAPLPLCSCGVVPAALGLRSAGASKNATVSFLVATPETGVDSISFTYVLMGPVMAVARPIAAVTSAIVAGLLGGRTESDSLVEQQVEEVKTSNSCRAPKQAPVIEEAQLEVPLLVRIKEGLKFAFGKMLKDVVNWLSIGLFIAALVQTFLPSDFFEILGDGFLSMVLMAVIGIPMYVCASASTPIAAGFLLAGLSPGAVLVFMLLGPASNIGTLMIVKNELGIRSVSAYIVGLVASAFFFGFLLNYLAQLYNLNFVETLQVHEHYTVAWY